MSSLLKTPETEARSMPMPRPTVSDSFISPQQPSSRYDVSNSQAPMAPLSSSPQAPDIPDSFLTRFILTPLRMISFLLSLALIDHRNRSYRVNQHTYSQSSFFGRVKHVLSSPWQDPEPYSEFGPAAQIAGSESTGYDWEKRREKERWTMKKKHRKMMRLEIKDALEMRMRVVVGLVFLSVFSGVVGVLMISMLWRMWNGGKGIV